MTTKRAEKICWRDRRLAAAWLAGVSIAAGYEWPQAAVAPGILLQMNWNAALLLSPLAWS